MPTSSAPKARRVVIVGAGFSGACVAVQLVRRSAAPLAITLIDPAERAGPGLAYSAIDPEHRLNAPTFAQSLIPDDAWHFSRWCQQHGVFTDDPQALVADTGAYVRREVYGRYLEQTLHAHRHWPVTGSTITHWRDLAVGLSVIAETAADAALAVTTVSGKVLLAHQVFIATGNPLPRLPAPFASELARHPSVIENGLDTIRLRRIAPNARVLVIGAGLTALDVVSTLIRSSGDSANPAKHRREIVVVSRHGLRPKPQGPLPAALAKVQGLTDLSVLPGGVVLDRLDSPIPAFLAAPVVPATARDWLHALRHEIGRVRAEGGDWYQPFDDLRDTLWQLWPTLPAAQKRRYLSKLRAWYDAHRFRSPPQNQALVDAAIDHGRVRFMAARLKSVTAVAGSSAIEVTMAVPHSVEALRERFDVVINCTGLDAAAGLTSNRFLVALNQAGLIRRDASGLGIEVDGQCRAVGADGIGNPMLRIVGPPTVGSCGDPIGAMFIGAQIHRMLPDALRALG